MKKDLLTHKKNTSKSSKLSKFPSEKYYQDESNIVLNENGLKINHLDPYNSTGVVCGNEDQADLDVHKDSNSCTFIEARENTECPDKSQNTLDSNEERDQTNLSYNNTNNSSNNSNTNIKDHLTKTKKNIKTNNNSNNSDDGDNKESIIKINTAAKYEKDSKFVCVHCAQEFVGGRDFTRHMRSAHNENTLPYSCHLCPKKFKLYDNYKKHMQQHQTLLLHRSDHKCFVCSQEFTNALSLSKHQTTHYFAKWKTMASKSQYSTTLQNVKIERTYVENNQHTHEVSSERQSPQAHEQGFNHSSTTQASTTAPSILSPQPTQHHENSPDSLLNTDSKFELKNFPSSSSSYSHILNDLKVDRFINPSLTTNVTTRSQSKVKLVDGDNVIDIVKGKKVVIYYCLKCDKSYNKQLFYVKHLRVHAGLKPFCCEICGKMFSSETHLAGHRHSHKQSKVYRCKICKTKFSIKQKLVLHEMMHEMQEPFKCHLCIARFVRDLALQEHLMTHPEHASKFGIVHTDQYEGCQQTNQPIIEEIILDQNIISDSMDGQVVYSHMEIPESVYSSDALLTNTISYFTDMACSQQAGLMEGGDKERSFNAHINPNTKTNDKTTKKKLYIDSNNTDTLTTINYISNSTTMQEAHSDNENTNDNNNDNNNNDSTNNDNNTNDQSTNDQLTNDHSTNNHVNDKPTIAKDGERINDVTHYLTPGGKKRAYIFCEVCGQAYKVMREYHDHMRKHTGQKPYCCKVCDKAFHSFKNLKAHRFTHLETKKHKCDVCGKGFKLSTCLKIHQRIHTGEKPYKCELCQERFNWRNDYMNHRRQHSGGNTCVHCNKKYARLEALREHINGKHKKVKPIKCKLCDERFSYSSAHYRHMKKHRGEGKDQNKKVHICQHCQKAFPRPSLLNRHILKAHPQLQANETLSDISV